MTNETIYRRHSALDAYYVRLYGLSRHALRYILNWADAKGADYPSKAFLVLRNREIREYEWYRTRRRVLEARWRLQGESE